MKHKKGLGDMGDKLNETISKPHYISPLSVRKKGININNSGKELISNFLIFWGGFVYLEVILKCFVFKSFDYTIIYSVFSCLMWASLAAIVTAISDSEVFNYIVAVAIFVIAEIVFITQFLYNRVIGDFYKYDDLKNIGSMSHFSSDIFSSIVKNILPLILLLVPIAVLIGLKIYSSMLFEEIFTFGKRKIILQIALIVISVISYLAIIVGVQIDNNKDVNVSKLYFNSSSNHNERVKNLGLFSASRLDLKWTLFDIYSSDDSLASPGEISSSGEAIDNNSSGEASK